MGYTHYWSIKKRDSIPVQAQEVLREILGQAYQQGTIQLEFNVAGPPCINDRLVMFNGVGDAGHETFRFDLDDDYQGLNGDHFAFCQ